MSDVLTGQVGISGDVVAVLNQTPSEIVTALQTILTLMRQIEEGSQADNPLSGLLGVLGGMAEGLLDLPDLGDATGPFSDLLGRLPADAVADIGRVSGTVAQMVQMLQPVIEAAARGSAEDTIRTLLDRNIDLVDQLGTGSGGEIEEIATQFSRFLHLFTSMTRWRHQAPQVDEVVELLANALVGAPSTLLDAPRAQIGRIEADFAELRLSGPDATRLAGIEVELTALWAEIEGHTTGEIDWPALDAALSRAQALQLELTGLRDRVIADCLQAVDGFQPPDLRPVAEALSGVARVKPARLTPVLDQLRNTIRGFADGLEGLAPTEEQLQALLFELIDGFFGCLEDSGLGQLRARLLTMQRQLIAAIRDLPLADLAQTIETALRDAAATLDGIDLDGLRQQALEPIRSARETVEEQAGDAIGASVGALWDEVESALNTVATQVAELETALRGAVDKVAGFLSQITEAIGEVESAIADITRVLDEFDLDTPCAEVVDFLAGLADKIGGIDISIIPEPARAPLSSLLGELEQIEVAVSINGPVDEVLAVIDPTPLLEGAAEALGGLLDELRKLDPVALVEQLDGPVDEVLAKLGEFGPEGLQALMDQAMAPVRGAIASVDFRTLLQPVIDVQDDIRGRIEGILDPGILLDPLEEAFQPIITAIDALEPTQYMGGIAGEGERMGQSAGQRAGPPAALADAGGVLKTELTSNVDTDDDLFGFRPGDLLIPLIDLHNRLFEALDELDGGIMDAAAAQLHDKLNGALAALDPARIESGLDEALDGVRTLCDPAAYALRLAVPVECYRTLSASISASVRVTAGDTQIVALRAQSRLEGVDPMALAPSAAQAAQIEAALGRARARLDLDHLRIAYATRAPGIADLLPAALDGGVDGTGLKAAMQALDPSPLRDEINAAFDEFGTRLLGFSEVLFNAMDAAFARVEDLFLPLTPNHLLSFAGDIHAELKAQLLALGPAALKEDLQPLFDAVKGLLDQIDLGRLADDLNSERDALADMLTGLVGELLPDPAPFRDLQARLAALKPSQLLGGALVEMQALSDALGRLDPRVLIQPLIDLIAEIRADLPICISRIEEAFDAVLAALQDTLSGGGVSGSVSVSGGVNVAA
ncbi:hypothetical protein [Sedimentitalea arenosa]|uniref:Uncharacterized protein n=1 Tax=Sedimentitalea arenosa TaxID=2798803 RepID=A0A8J7IYU4_9RHOB|nr:hypothetical protein [Arenibacterium arenosum]MBJ6369925.1 hypothetical protein [Arenibacterium arenosum]